VSDEAVSQSSVTYVPTFAVFHEDRGQLWVNIRAVTSLVNNSRIAIYNVRTGGWSICNAGISWTCAAMAGDIEDAVTYTQVSSRLKPYFGSQQSYSESGESWVVKFDDERFASDLSSAWNGWTTPAKPNATGVADSVTSRPFFPAGMGTAVTTHDAMIAAEVASGVTVTLTVIQDFGVATKTATVSLTATGSETHVIRRAEDSGFGELMAVQYKLVGDGNQYIADAVTARVKALEDRA
jgi:hypothetical protein